jgi:hypothetical protein
MDNSAFYKPEKKHEDVPLNIEHKGTRYEGIASPLLSSCRDGNCYEFDVVLNNEPLGTIYSGLDHQWVLQNLADQELIEKIGEQIRLWYDNMTL